MRGEEEERDEPEEEEEELDKEDRALLCDEMEESLPTELPLVLMEASFF